MNINNRVAVITGAASGIGAACARAFHQAGARVVCVDINGEGAKAVADEFGGLGLGCDVANENAVADMVTQVKAEVGDIEVFFSNAGIATGGGPLETPLDVWENQWEVNVMAHVHAIRAVLPDMLARGEGYLLHTASMAGILTTHNNLTYATTKHAVVGLAEWMSITYHNKGIRVSLLAPLGVRTPMLGDTDQNWASSSAAGPIKEPEEVAQQVLSAIADERFLILTDEIAQTWMDRKAGDLERWLKGMRRMQDKLDDAKEKGVSQRSSD
ncbi:MAG: SDR family NAD(P)-dependent oxidoreductase [Proteobacteria bacterium]|nr:SDR family NAD(P)-dependent oxidoreductase [Pseudomonadota bacterium]